MSITDVRDQWHLSSTFFYVLDQRDHHAVGGDFFHEATSLPDLLGMRKLGAHTRQLVRERLPPMRLDLLPILGVPELEPGGARRPARHLGGGGDVPARFCGSCRGSRDGARRGHRGGTGGPGPAPCGAARWSCAERAPRPFLAVPPSLVRAVGLQMSVRGALGDLRAGGLAAALPPIASARRHPYFSLGLRLALHPSSPSRRRSPPSLASIATCVTPPDRRRNSPSSRQHGDLRCTSSIWAALRPPAAPASATLAPYPDPHEHEVVARGLAALLGHAHEHVGGDLAEAVDHAGHKHEAAGRPVRLHRGELLGRVLRHLEVVEEGGAAPVADQLAS